MIAKLADSLWGQRAKWRYLLLAAVILLFTLLGSREIWTQEHRWADIVSGMFYRHDFFHPYLGQATYYDKPLLSYWLIALLSSLTGTLSTWVLRLPSALSGVLALWAIFRLGTQIKNRQLGLLAAWMLLTTYFFVFWARTSSADMLNMAGSLFAVSWYFDKKQQASGMDYAVFFMILALTSLCKGLVGAMVPLLAVFVDIVLQRSWRRHLRWPLLFAVIPALTVYLLPFWLSSHFGGEQYGESGLYLVYKENVLRYFKPFDHRGPLYTYFVFLPIYTLPWAFFLVPALLALRSRWTSLSLNVRWLIWSLLVIFLFFTVSGSRRSYYVLPLVPFAILLTAEWITAAPSLAWRQWLATVVLIVTYVILFLGMDVVPAWYYSQVGVEKFAVQLKREAAKQRPWPTWQVVMLDAETKLDFYLQLPPDTRHYSVIGERETLDASTITAAWPILNDKPKNTIFVTREQYVSALLPYFQHYFMFKLEQPTHFLWQKKAVINAPVAFIPIEKKS